MEELTAYFLSCGFSNTRAVDTAKGKTSAVVKSFFTANEIETKQLTDKQALLVVNIVTAKEGATLKDEQRRLVLAAVLDGRLTAGDQVTGESNPDDETSEIRELTKDTNTAALQFLTKTPLPVDEAAFNKACGVGASFFGSTSFDSAHLQLSSQASPLLQKRSNLEFDRSLNPAKQIYRNSLGMVSAKQSAQCERRTN